nr:hypothetical protein [Tanacetum cinerariifolium]
NTPNKYKKDVVTRKTRSQTIIEVAVAGKLTNSTSIQKPRTQQRQRSQLKINSQLDDTIADIYDERGQKLKGPAVEDPTVQSLLDQPVAREGLSVAHNKYYDTDSDAILYSLSLDKTEESANEIDDADESGMDLSDDNLIRDNDATR